MKASILLALIQYVLICAYTPGPANIYSMKTASAYGYGRFLRIFPGLLLGCITNFLVCATVLLFFREYVSFLMPYLTVLGTLYMLVLTYKIWKSKPADITPVTSTDSDTPYSKAPGPHTGFLINITNMKTAIFALTTLQVYLLPYSESVPQIYLTTLCISAFVPTSTLVWAFFGKLINRYYSSHFRLINTIMALMLLLCIVTGTICNSAD